MTLSSRKLLIYTNDGRKQGSFQRCHGTLTNPPKPETDFYLSRPKFELGTAA